MLNTSPTQENYVEKMKGGFSNFDNDISSLILDSSAETLDGTEGAKSAENAASLPVLDGSVDSASSAGITIDAIASDGNGVSLLKKLQAIGLQFGNSFGAVASGLLPIVDVASLLGMADIASIREASSSVGRVQSIPAEAAIGLHADKARSQYSVDGAGITVGIISDSFNKKVGVDEAGASDTMSTDIANGYLPNITRLLNDDPYAGGTDEGRGMAQIVHQIAPGASIIFDTGEGGQAAFAQHILDLAAAGANIIVDDLTYSAEPDYQNGVIAQAIEKVEAEGVTYLSSAGNDGTAGYEGKFTADQPFSQGGISYRGQQFSTGNTVSDDLLPVNVSAGSDIDFELEWNQPAASAGSQKGATGDLDLFLLDNSGNIVASSTSNNVGGDPVEVLEKNFSAAGTFYLKVGVRNGTTAPTDMRIVASGDGDPVSFGDETSNTNTGTLVGHHGAAGSSAVGAVYYRNTPAYNNSNSVSESYSSGGTDNIYFDDAGNLLTSPFVQNVSFSATDGVDTSFFGNGDSDNDSFTNFFGTSAAAPSAAAVAALMLQVNSTLTPGQIAQILSDSTVATQDATGASDPVVGGKGLIQADKALQNSTAPPPPTALSLDASTDSGVKADDITNVSRVEIEGTAQTGSTVTLYDSDQSTVLGHATATDGRFQITSIIVLGDGVHELTATASNMVGVSAYSSFFDVTIDTKSPTMPAVPYDASVVNTYVDAANDTAGQTVTGTAEAGSRIDLYDRGDLVDTTTADTATGAWSALLGTLQDGSTHRYTATATDTAGNISAMSGALAFTVDTTPPTITAVSDSGPGIDADGDGNLHAGRTVTLTVTTSEAVTVTPGSGGGTPTLTLNDGGTATYTGGSGTAQQTFSYIVAAGQNTAKLAVTALNANGATVTDQAGNPLNPSLTAAAVPSGTLVVDTTPPTYGQGRAALAAGSDLGAGKVVTFTMATSEPVTVTEANGGVPTLRLNANGEVASYTGAVGSPVSTLTFSYMVQPGDNEADLVAGAIGDLPAGTTIRDGASNDANPATFKQIDTGIQVDTTPPVASSPTDTVVQNNGPTSIGIAAPTDNLTATGSLAIAAGMLPTDGTVTLANGQKVRTGQALTSAQLTGLLFTPMQGLSNQGSTFTYSVTDGAGNRSTGTAALNIGGPGAPTITGTHATITGDEVTVAPFAGVALGDPNAGIETMTIVLSDGGTLSGSGLTANSDNTYGLSGLAAEVTAELDGLAFTPSRGSPGIPITTTFTLIDTSDAGTNVTDSTTSVTDTASNLPSPAPTLLPPPAVVRLAAPPQPVGSSTGTASTATSVSPATAFRTLQSWSADLMLGPTLHTAETEATTALGRAIHRDASSISDAIQTALDRVSNVPHAALDQAFLAGLMYGGEGGTATGLGWRLNDISPGTVTDQVSYASAVTGDRFGLFLEKRGLFS